MIYPRLQIVSNFPKDQSSICYSSYLTEKNRHLQISTEGLYNSSIWLLNKVMQLLTVPIIKRKLKNFAIKYCLFHVFTSKQQIHVAIGWSPGVTIFLQKPKILGGMETEIYTTTKDLHSKSYRLMLKQLVKLWLTFPLGRLATPCDNLRHPQRNILAEYTGKESFLLLLSACSNEMLQLLYYVVSLTSQTDERLLSCSKSVSVNRARSRRNKYPAVTSSSCQISQDFPLFSHVFSDFSSIRSVDVKNSIFRNLLWKYIAKTKTKKTWHWAL